MPIDINPRLFGIIMRTLNIFRVISRYWHDTRRNCFHFKHTLHLAKFKRHNSNPININDHCPASLFATCTKIHKTQHKIMFRFNVCLHVWHVLQNWTERFLQFWKAIKLTFFSIYEIFPLPAAETSRQNFYLLTIDTTINNNGKDFDFRVDHRSNTFPFLTSFRVPIDAGFKIFIDF